jgi:signal transduction histidine kinase
MSPLTDPAPGDAPAAAADPLELPRAWGSWLTFLCALPCGLLAFGLDLGTPVLEVPTDGLASLAPQQLAELAHRSLRGAMVHSLLEWTAFCTSVFVCGLALVQFRLTRDPALPIMGCALLCAGVLDGFHILVSDRLVRGAADPNDLIPFTWAISRFCNAALQCAALLIVAQNPSVRTGRNRMVAGVALVFTLLGCAVIDYCATATALPQTTFSGSTIKRPYDLYPLVPIALGAAVLRFGLLRTRPSLFGYTLLLAMIPATAAQLYMAFGSSALYDGAFHLAHGLKAASYAIPLLGLVGEYGQAFRRRARLTLELASQAEELRAKTAQLQAAQSRIAASEKYARALNETQPANVYRQALQALREEVGAVIAALYSLEEGRLGCRMALAIDDRPLASELFASEGLPASVVASGSFEHVAGPFRDPHLELRTGLGDVSIACVSACPIRFEGRSIGALLVGHPRTPGDDLQGIVELRARQLAVRLNGIQSEAQRQRLVSDLRLQSAALKDARFAAEQASRVKSEFLASMSHELRTPLHSILGFTQRVLKRARGGLGTQDVDALETVERNGHHLLGLINAVLDLAQIDSGRMALEKDVFDLCALAREVVERVRPLAEARGLTLASELGSAIEIEADPVKIDQILTNLLGNAIKYTERGSVTLACSEEHDGALGLCARISVRDTGIGIEPEERDNLFKQFSRLQAGRASGATGSGLGLVLTARYVEMHGGRIDVESAPRQGSHFCVWLPQEPAGAEAHKPERT